jgi:hypothetical protein
MVWKIIFAMISSLSVPFTISGFEPFSKCSECCESSFFRRGLPGISHAYQGEIMLRCKLCYCLIS